MKKNIITSALLITAFLISSCSGSLTDLSGTWKKPGFSGKKFNKILVVAISNDLVKRSTIESALAKELKQDGINATTSTSVLDLSSIEKSSDGKIDSTKLAGVKKSLGDAGYDGAIVISLLDIKEKTDYVPGQTYYQPNYYGYYGNYGYGSYAFNGFYNYSFNTYSVVNTPGYYVQKTNIFIETRLFDLANDDMVWASQSETLNPANLKDFASSYSIALATALIDKKVVK